MPNRRMFVCLSALLLFAAGLAGAQTTPTFTLSASNTTMPASGVGSIPFTLTSVDGFYGNVIMSCTPPNEPTGVTLPLCGFGGPVIVVALDANATVKENIELLASAPVPEPVKLDLRKHRGGSGLALAGAVMLGFGVGRRRVSRLGRVFLACGLLFGLTAIGACGGSQKTLTPGIYTYTLSASGQGSFSPTTATAAVTVTVPAGIVVKGA